MAILLRKPRLEALPRYIGPGPVRLVMREVLAKLVASSFKSGAVLKKLEVCIPRLIEIKNRYLNLFNKISFRFLGAKRPLQITCLFCLVGNCQIAGLCNISSYYCLTTGWRSSKT